MEDKEVNVLEIDFLNLLDITPEAGWGKNNQLSHWFMPIFQKLLKKLIVLVLALTE